MKKILTALIVGLFVFGFSSLAFANSIWTEDFQSYTEGTGIVGTGTGYSGDYPDYVTKWTLGNPIGSLSGNDSYFKTKTDDGTLKLEGQDIDGEVIWESESISITGYSNVSFSILVTEDGDHEAADYVDIFYSIDGGAYSRILNWNGVYGDANHTIIGDYPDDGDWLSLTITKTGLSGSTIKLKVALSNNAVAEQIQIDDILVEGGVYDPTDFAIEYVASTKTSLTWTAPSGTYDNVLVFGRDGSAVDHSPSGAGSGYNNANADWGSAGSYNNSKLLYSGTGTTVTITGLTEGNTYYFKAYAYDDSDWSDGTSDLNDEAEVQGVSDFTASPGNGQVSLSWTNYSGAQGSWWDQVLVLAKSGSAVDGTPSGDGSAYNANAAFGSGTGVGTGNYVVFKGTGTSETVTSLTNGTTYYFRAFVRDGSDWTDADEYESANVTPSDAQQYDVIINEFSQGSDGAKEWVELLVVTDVMDLRGWELGDMDDGTWGNGPVFSSSEDWNNIPQGTLIVIYNSADVDGTIGSEDTDFSDKSVKISSANSTYFSGSWGSYTNTDGDDLPVIRDAVDNVIHDMAITYPSSTISGPGGGQVTYYTSNTKAGVETNSNWTTSASTNATPGSPNGGDNTTWIDQTLPVILSTFTAQYLNNVPTLYWVTQSETDNIGFYVYRNTQNDFITSMIISDLIPGYGTTTEPHSYIYEDHIENVFPGDTYWYWLESVDFGGMINHYDKVAHIVIPENYDPGNENPEEFEEFGLFQSNPNPFNPKTEETTEISFSLKENSKVQINIYNIKGELVKTIYDGFNTADEAIWDGKDESGKLQTTGMYLCSLIVNDKLYQTKRLILLR